MRNCSLSVGQAPHARVYYDFLDKYVDRRDFEMMYMDTDSSYFAISGEELRDIVRPETARRVRRRRGKLAGD